MDEGYRTFLNLLQRPNDTLQTLPDATVHGAIVHYLCSLQPVYVPGLVRAIVTSQTLWNNQKWVHLAGTQLAARQAVRDKFASLEKSIQSGIFFSADLVSPLKAWVATVLEGLSGHSAGPDQIHAKIALLGGLLQGLLDVAKDVNLQRSQSSIQDLLISECSRALDLCSSSDRAGWTNEFAQSSSDSESLIVTTVKLVSQTLILVPGDKLRVLDLETLLRSSLSVYMDTFHNGAVFAAVREIGKDSNGKWSAAPQSSLARDVAALHDNTSFTLLSSICKLMARSILLLADQDASKTWMFMEQTIEVLHSISYSTETVWVASPLSNAVEDADLAKEIRPTTLRLWQAFKTLLFSTVVIAQPVVTVISSQGSPRKLSSLLSAPTSGPSPTAHQLASRVLRALFHLAFISSKFGGLTADGGGFTEQKRVFFAALDVVGTDVASSEELISFLSASADNGLEDMHPVSQSHAAFFLACAEQLIPSVSDNTVETKILPFAKRFLSDPAHRETFESAHSVVLSIFSNNGNRGRKSSDISEGTREALAVRLAPFYLGSLLENAAEDRLSTIQLRLAYHSLVRSASASSDNAAAWLCVDQLLKAVRAAGNQSSSAALEHRLRLTLVSLISAVNAGILPRLLAEIEGEMKDQRNGEYRAELVKEIHDQVMTRVGDAQKEIATEWWLKLRRGLEIMPRETAL